MAEYDAIIEEGGTPALVLAGAARVDPDTKSGNPAHEIRTGRFGSVGRKKNEPPPKPPAKQKPDQSEIRRRDAVVDAARTLTDLTPDGVREFVRKRWRGTRVLTDKDVEEFASDASRQRIEDIVDSLDYRVRKGVYGRQGSKVVKVDFPRGHVRSSLRGMSDEEVNEVLQRLRVRGWSFDQVRKHVIRPYQLRDRDVLTGLAHSPDKSLD